MTTGRIWTDLARDSRSLSLHAKFLIWSVPLNQFSLFRLVEVGELGCGRSVLCSGSKGGGQMAGLVLSPAGMRGKMCIGSFPTPTPV